MAAYDDRNAHLGLYADTIANLCASKTRKRDDRESEKGRIGTAENTIALLNIN